MIVEELVRGALGIVGVVMDVTLGAAGTVLTALPGMAGVSSSMLVGYGFLNTFLPFSEVAMGIVGLLSLYVFLFSYRFIREMWNLVPIIGGHG